MKIRQPTWLILMPFLAGSLPGADRPLGNIDQEQSTFEKTLASDPRNKPALFMLGLIYEKKGQTANALRIWQSYVAVETDPQQRAIAQKHIHQLSQ